MFELKKGTEELSLIALKINVKFEGKLTCTFQNDMNNLADFHQSTFESLKIGSFLGCFYPNSKMCELEIYRGVMCHENEE